MALPAGKTCDDCAFLPRCTALFGCKPTNVRCDFSPSRFHPHPAGKRGPTIEIAADKPWSPYK
jgi:hypothetical protein